MTLPAPPSDDQLPEHRRPGKGLPGYSGPAAGGPGMPAGPPGSPIFNPPPTTFPAGPGRLPGDKSEPPVVGGPVPPTGPGAPAPAPSATPWIDAVQAVYPWLTGPLLQAFIRAWQTTGDWNQALAAMRQDPAYDRVFAGNRNPDGSFKFSEEDYLREISRFENALTGIGLNPDIFRFRFGEMIGSNLTADEFAARIDYGYDQVIDAAPSVREAYSRLYGGTAFQGQDRLSDAAIIAMMLDGSVSEQILRNQIDTASVSAAAYDAGFGWSQDLASRIVSEGFAGEADAFFAQAGEQVPFLGRLAQRHYDPNDAFNIDDFANALLFGDAGQRAQMRRLLAAESSLFGSGGRFAAQGSRIGGLEQA